MGAQVTIAKSENPSDNPARKRALRLKFCEDMARSETLLIDYRRRYAAEAEALGGKKAAEYLPSTASATFDNSAAAE